MFKAFVLWPKNVMGINTGAYSYKFNCKCDAEQFIANLKKYGLGGKKEIFPTAAWLGGRYPLMAQDVNGSPLAPQVKDTFYNPGSDVVYGEITSVFEDGIMAIGVKDVLDPKATRHNINVNATDGMIILNRLATRKSDEDVEIPDVFTIFTPMLKPPHQDLHSCNDCKPGPFISLTPEIYTPGMFKAREEFLTDEWCKDNCHAAPTLPECDDKEKVGAAIDPEDKLIFSLRKKDDDDDESLSIYREGRAAGYTSGLKINPYTSDTIKAQMWEDGFNLGKTQRINNHALRCVADNSNGRDDVIELYGAGFLDKDDVVNIDFNSNFCIEFSVPHHKFYNNSYIEDIYLSGMAKKRKPYKEGRAAGKTLLDKLSPYESWSKANADWYRGLFIGRKLALMKIKSMGADGYVPKLKVQEAPHVIGNESTGPTVEDKRKPTPGFDGKAYLNHAKNIKYICDAYAEGNAVGNAGGDPMNPYTQTPALRTAWTYGFSTGMVQYHLPNGSLIKWM